MITTRSQESKSESGVEVGNFGKVGRFTSDSATLVTRDTIDAKICCTCIPSDKTKTNKNREKSSCNPTEKSRTYRYINWHCWFALNMRMDECEGLKCAFRLVMML